MSEREYLDKVEVSLVREVYGVASYRGVVDTEFRQLVSPEAPEEDPLTVEQFFSDYEDLFYEIPITGDDLSHEYLVRRSGEYIGGSVISDNERALLDEINDLRQQLLDANQALADVTQTPING